ncbi:MAG: T9SS type A sorting domain-containing protein [Bacteroidia bacterium]
MNSFKKTFSVRNTYTLISKLPVFVLTLLAGMFQTQDLHAQQPPVELHWSPANPRPNDEVTIFFTMGTYEYQASNVYQIDESFLYSDSSFQLSWNLNDTIPLDGDGSWFANDQYWSGYMLIDTSIKKIVLHLERPSNDPRSGYETLAVGDEIVIVIEDVLLKKAPKVSFSTKVYPNPSNGYLFLESLDGTSIEQISVMNLTGQLVRTFNAGQPIFKANLSDLPDQMYIIKVTGSDKTVHNHRWVKQ